MIAFLGAASEAAWRPFVAALRAGLASANLVEGTHMRIGFRWAEGDYRTLPDHAAQFVRAGVSIIVATGGILAVRAALAATKTTPIVFTLAADPVEQGFVASLGQPGGNVAGIALIAHHLLPKRMELLHALVPRAAKIAVLVHPGNPARAYYKHELQAAASAYRRKLEFIEARGDSDFEASFEFMARERVGGLLVAPDPNFDQSRLLVVLAARHALPTIYNWREQVEAGGLISYGISISDAYRQVGIYTARILNGESPDALPVLQPTKVEFAVNLRTAKMQGIAIPDSVLVRADAVIE